MLNNNYIIKCFISLLVIASSTLSTAFLVNDYSSPQQQKRQSSNIILQPTNLSKLHATVGPMARANKLLDPKEYNRVIEQKMKQTKTLTRAQAEADYNAYLENPQYFALDKQENYYKNKGYKDAFEGMIGEAEKEGRGEEVRERIQKFKTKSKIKAYSVLIIFIATFLYARSVYNIDPEHFLPGI